MTSKQHNGTQQWHLVTSENFQKKISKKYNTQKKFFSNKKYIHKIFFLPKVCLYPRRGTPSNTFYLLKIRAPNKPLSAIFPILYIFMGFFGFRWTCLDFLFIFGTALFIFGISCPLVSISLFCYIEERARICVYVPILSLFCSFSEIWYKNRYLCIISEKKFRKVL